MSDPIFHIKSISELAAVAGLPKPTHPQLICLDVSEWEIGAEQVGRRFLTDFYSVGLKDSSCGHLYGRHAYDFDEGVLYFSAPGQVTTIMHEQKRGDIQGWMIFFHPDLIRSSHLGQAIEEYHFFSYEVHEALHLSAAEQEVITAIYHNIQRESAERIDGHSNRVMISSLELLLNYSQRYYERQFITRRAVNLDVYTQVKTYLKQRFETGAFAESGQPTVAELAEQVHLSPHYLSDLLKRESGKTAKEHINDFLIEKAKLQLLNSQDSVSSIAYDLGFNYPHYFSRLFKAKTGLSPADYRQSN